MPVEAPIKPIATFADIMSKELEGVVPPPTAIGAPTTTQPVKIIEPKPAVTEPKPVTNFDEVDREIETGKRSPKSDDFKRVKTAASEFRKKFEEAEPKLKEYEKELSELKKAPKHNAELIKTITEERDRYKGMFEQVAVEISPEFHAKYQTRLDSVKATLPSDTADKFMAVLQLPDSDIKRQHLAELTSEMTEFQVAEIVAANREVRTILNDRQGELKKAQDSLAKIGEERTKKAQERTTALSKTFDDVIAKSQDPKNGIPAFQTKEGNEAWNKGVNERLAVAKAIFDGNLDSDAEKAEAALWASTAPEFLKQLKSVTAELAAANETIAKMRGSTPAIAGQGTPGNTGAKLTFAQRVDAEMRGQLP